MKRKIIAIVLLLVFGAAKLPFEYRFGEEQREVFLRGETLDLSLRESLGQMAFLAALGGFRSLIAAVLWIEAHAAWERTEWGRMAGLLDTVTTLQPRSLLYWDMASWHMAWNASIAALNDPDQPSETLRQRNQQRYFELGKAFLEEGIRNNPDRPTLYDRMGILLRDKFDDHCGAGEAYLKASEFPDAPSYARRFAGYELAKCPGREREAYDILRELYLEDESHHLPTLLVTLTELEDSLDIPQDERLNIELPEEYFEEPEDPGAESPAELPRNPPVPREPLLEATDQQP